MKVCIELAARYLSFDPIGDRHRGSVDGHQIYIPVAICARDAVSEQAKDLCARFDIEVPQSNQVTEPNIGVIKGLLLGRQSQNLQLAATKRS